MNMLELLPAINIVLAIIVIGYAAIIAYSFARKLHKKWLREAIAECIIKNSQYVHYNSVDEIIDNIIELEEKRINISFDVVEGAYLLFLTEKYARDRMRGIYRKVGKKDGQFTAVLHEWRRKGLDSGVDRLIDRISAYEDSGKKFYLFMFRFRIEEFRRRSIEGFCEIFSSIPGYVDEREPLTKHQLLVKTI